jgi:hypothetical protein
MRPTSLMNRPFTIVRFGLLALALTSSCAGYTKGIRPDEKLSADSAYLYGRFLIKSERSFLGLDGYPTVRLALRCADGEIYRIRFSTERAVQVIKIKPARCALVQIVYTDADGTVRGYRRPPLAWVHGEDFAPGRAYYLGDFMAAATFKSDWKVVYTELHWDWAMNPVDDGYESSTAEMKTTFTKLAALSTDDRRLAPRRPPRPPGAIGPPLSPERVARIAPFTKHSYPTPMACEEACPMGRCLPYRGADRTAMACIIRCKADQDCPGGWGCNCPSSGRPDCRPIARTTEDPMDGICMPVDPESGRR